MRAWAYCRNAKERNVESGFIIVRLSVDYQNYVSGNPEKLLEKQFKLFFSTSKTFCRFLAGVY